MPEPPKTLKIINFKSYDERVKYELAWLKYLANRDIIEVQQQGNEGAMILRTMRRVKVDCLTQYLRRQNAHNQHHHRNSNSILRLQDLLRA